MAEVGIIVTATDKATAVLQSIGQKGSVSLERIGTASKALPGQISKASGAFVALSGALGEVGGTAGATMGRIASLGSLLAGGGWIGVALAAISVAAVSGKVAWEAYTFEAKRLAGFLPTLAGTFDLLRKSTEDSKASSNDAAQALADWGKTSREAARDAVDADIARRESAQKSVALDIERMNSDIRLMQAKIKLEKDAGRGSDENAKALEKQLAMEMLVKNTLSEKLAISEQNLFNSINEAAALDELASRENEQKTRSENLAASKQRAAALDRRYAELQEKDAAERQERDQRMLASLDRLNAKIALRNRLEQRASAGLNDIMNDNRKRVDDLSEKEAEAAESASEKTKAAWQSAGNVVSSSFGSALTAVAFKEKTVGQAAKDMAKSIGTSAIQAALQWAVAEGIKKVASLATLTATTTATVATSATNIAAKVAEAEVTIGAASAQAMADSIASTAPALPAGLALGAANVAAIQAARSFMLFDTGGIAKGSGLAYVHDKERILDNRQTVAFERLVDSLSSSRGVPSSHGGPAIVNNFHEHPIFSATSAETKRRINQVGKATKRQRRLGYVT